MHYLILVFAGRARWNLEKKGRSGPGFQNKQESNVSEAEARLARWEGERLGLSVFIQRWQEQGHLRTERGRAQIRWVLVQTLNLTLMSWEVIEGC